MNTRTLTPDELALTHARRLAHVATVNPDGSPLVAPMWFLERDGVFYLSMLATIQTLKNARRTGKVNLSIATDEAPYKRLIIRGRLQSVDDTSAEEWTRRIGHRYFDDDIRDETIDELLSRGPRTIVTIVPAALQSKINK